MINSYAYYDALSISLKLSDTKPSISEIELHLFGYLACLLSLYKRRPASTWKYEFALTKYAFPFSPSLHKAIDALIINRYFVTHEGIVKTTSTATSEYRELTEFSLYSEREEFLEVACSCALVIPGGNIRDSLTNLPPIKSQMRLEQSADILGDISIRILHDHFEFLYNIIGRTTEDLIIPALAWLYYLDLMGDG